MRLVGATSGFIRGPFLIEGIFYSVIAILITCAILYPFLVFVQPYLNNFFGSASVNILEYVRKYFFQIFGYEFLGVVILNILASSMAIRKYLRV